MSNANFNRGPAYGLSAEVKNKVSRTEPGLAGLNRTWRRRDSNPRFDRRRPALSVVLSGLALVPQFPHRERSRGVRGGPRRSVPSPSLPLQGLTGEEGGGGDAGGGPPPPRSCREPL